MKGLVFVDTNILFYLFDTAEPLKQEIARRAFFPLAQAGRVVLSTQILKEFYSSVTRRMKPPLSPSKARSALEDFLGLSIVQLDPQLILEATRLHEAHSISFWDALVVGAAQKGGCNVLLTEDLQHGRRWGNLEVENPFRGGGDGGDQVMEAPQTY